MIFFIQIFCRGITMMKKKNCDENSLDFVWGSSNETKIKNFKLGKLNIYYYMI